MRSPPGEMRSLNSSNLLGARYDENSRTLTIEFRNGDMWEYGGVPQETVDGLYDATSPGSYFHRSIKGRYSSRQIS